MNISGKAKIFSKEINGRNVYSTGLSNKREDGTYENMYIGVQLPKNVILANNTDIEIKKGFLSFYNDKNGIAHCKIIVLEFENLSQEEFQISSDDELPF
jgi:hypothetical protein